MIIAVTGNNGVGKTYFAEYISEDIEALNNYSKIVTNTSFAEAPNEIYEQISGIDFRNLSRDLKEKERPRFINFCEINKDLFGNDVWIKFVLQEFENCDNLIISDLRFQNEFEMLSAIEPDLIVVGIKNKEEDTFNIPCTYTILNNGSLEEFNNKIDDFLINQRILTQY